MEHAPSEVPVVFGDEAVDEELAEWLAANHLALDDPELLATGGSGGKLVSAYLRAVKGRRRPQGLRIVKLVAPAPDSVAEPANHRSALDSRVSDNEDFIERHLVKLDDLAIWKMSDNSWVMFQFPAGDGVVDTETLAALGRPSHLPELAAEIVKGVLGEWNPDARIDNKKKISAAEFVMDLLGARLDQNSPLRTWTRDRFGTELDNQEFFSLEGRARPLPNPLFLAAGSRLSTCQVRLAMRGRAHGDLHPGNIMLPVGADAPPTDYWLVDLSRFREDALLARDPAHLLVCLIADAYLPHMSCEARDELIAALVGTEPRCDGPLIPQGLAALVTRVREEVIGWGASRRINQGGWRQQWYLALQACALMVTARDRYSDRDRFWFYRLASEACGAYLEKMEMEFPPSAPVLRARGIDTQARDAVAVAPSRRPTTTVRPQAPINTVIPDAGADGVAAAASAVARSADPEPAALPTDLALLNEIWDTFEHPLQQLDSLRFAQLPPGIGEFIRSRATRFRMELGNPSRIALGPGGAGDRDHLQPVREALRRVADKANELRQSLQDPGRRLGLALVARPAALNETVSALDDLLDEVSRATEALSPRLS